MARMIVTDHEYVTKKYNLHKLKEIEELVAEAVEVLNILAGQTDIQIGLLI